MTTMSLFFGTNRLQRTVRMHQLDKNIAEAKKDTKRSIRSAQQSIDNLRQAIEANHITIEIRDSAKDSRAK